MSNKKQLEKQLWDWFEGFCKILEATRENHILCISKERAIAIKQLIFLFYCKLKKKDKRIIQLEQRIKELEQALNQIQDTWSPNRSIMINKIQTIARKNISQSKGKAK